MKISLNTESSNMLIKAREISGVNFNALLREAMELLLQKYNNNALVHNDQTTDKNTTRST